MAIEIERKFLVRNDAWRDQARPGQPMRQGYIGTMDKASVRVRQTTDRAWLNIKGATLGVQRREYEYPIPAADAEEILTELCSGALIEKTRFEVPFAGHLWEIDVFEGANAGLVVAEIELSSPDQPFQRPDWLGEEVSDDPRYYNACLVEHPWREW
ncbi:CYTH domain-containing protein [Methylonatrum kenyense]|uniref:CYTH domain-containing protein n=1 Tax=Methylonatrum kenyense TaxID=455253 RepID=UPI0020BEDE70|nr:CYTH domain-containing protein [Methylonatrum kenyense]